MSAYVQDLGSNAPSVNASTTVVTLTAEPTAGNLVVGIHVNNSTQTITSVADSRGNTWTVDAHAANTTSPASVVTICHTVQNVAHLQTGDTVTFTLSASSTGGERAALLQEYTAKDGLDQVAGTHGNSATLSTGTTPTTTSTSEVAVAAFATGTGQTSWTHDSNYSVPTLNLLKGSSGDRTLLTEYRDLTTTGGQSAGGTITSTTWAGVIATYKVPHAGGTVLIAPATATGDSTASTTVSLISGKLTITPATATGTATVPNSAATGTSVLLPVVVSNEVLLLSSASGRGVSTATVSVTASIHKVLSLFQATGFGAAQVILTNVTGGSWSVINLDTDRSLATVTNSATAAAALWRRSSREQGAPERMKTYADPPEELATAARYVLWDPARNQIVSSHAGFDEATLAYRRILKRQPSPPLLIIQTVSV